MPDVSLTPVDYDPFTPGVQSAPPGAPGPQPAVSYTEPTPESPESFPYLNPQPAGQGLGQPAPNAPPSDPWAVGQQNAPAGFPGPAEGGRSFAPLEGADTAEIAARSLASNPAGNINTPSWDVQLDQLFARPKLPGASLKGAKEIGLGAAEMLAPSITSLARGDQPKPVPELPASADTKARSAEDPRISGVGEDIVSNLLGPPGAKAGAGLAAKTLPAMFLGVGAKTADKAALKEAQDMLQRGIAMRVIRRETGWEMTRDGKWKYEISDQPLKFKPHADKATRLDELVDHPELFKAYPNLRSMAIGDIEALQREMPGMDVRGYYQPRVSKDSPEHIGINTSLPDARETAAHELQHAVQRREKFAVGGTSRTPVVQELSEKVTADLIKKSEDKQLELLDGLDQYLTEHKGRLSHYELVREYWKANPELKKELDWAHDVLSDKVAIRKEIANRTYLNLAGEVEARNVSRRIDMTDAERRDIPPEATEDVPRNSHLIRFDNSKELTRNTQDLSAQPKFDPNTVSSGRAPYDDHTTIMVNPKHLDEAFRTDAPEMAQLSPERLERMREYAKSGKPISAPEVGVVDGKVGFTNGRHRARIAAESDLEEIPVSVEKGNVKALQDRLGQLSRPEIQADMRPTAQVREEQRVSTRLVSTKNGRLIPVKTKEQADKLIESGRAKWAE